MNWMKRVFKFVKTVFSWIFGVVVGLGLFYVVGKTFIQPLAPLVTGGLVIVLTLITFLNWKTAILAIVGIALYVLSWPTVGYYGVVIAQLVCFVGFFTWLAAVLFSFRKAHDHTTMPVLC